MARPSQVEERVRAILDPRLEHRPVGAWQVRFAALTLVAAAAALGAVKVASASAPDDPAFPSGLVQTTSFGAKTRTETKTGVATVSRKTVLAAPKGGTGSSWYDRRDGVSPDERYDDAIAAFQKAIELATARTRRPTTSRAATR